MPEKQRFKLLYIILIAALLGCFFFTRAPRSYVGVDEAVLEKIAAEHGRKPRRPFIDPGEGDILLFLFLGAGAIGGFMAGYYWRSIVDTKPDGKEH
ncbi:cobalt ABC transporter permease [Geotalea sp. SG265]|uniref:cobalt ABC transporter permease n=1 Tax=Geotalea sp. SG265 TaxID=2922867 RepID=UPI001FAEB72F|nr:cobalt ABC transporter permease [Geotalea sp. SG265]